MIKKIAYLMGAFAFMALGYVLGLASGQYPHPAMAEKGLSKGIGEYIRHFDGTNASPTPKGFQFWFVPLEMSGHLMNLKMSQVKAKDSNHAPHQHPEEEILLLLEGTAEFILGNETQVVKENTSLYCPPGIMHGLRNVGDTPIRYLVIKNK